MKDTLRKARQDGGHSLAEVLVTVGLLVLVTGIVYGLIIHTQKVTRVATTGSFTESQMLDGISRVSRDIAIANPIVRAGKTDLTVNAARGGKCVQTRYWVADTNADGVTDALVSATDVNGDGTLSPADAGAAGADQCSPNAGNLTVAAGMKPTVIVNGLSANARAQMFTYYGDDDTTALGFNGSGWVANPDAIRRVKIGVSAAVTGRNNLMTLATSSSPRVGEPGTTTFNDPPPPAAAPEPTTVQSCATTIPITWGRVLGATGYLVLKGGTQVADINDPSITQYMAGSEIAGGFAYGDAATYQVIAKSVGGFSVGNTAITVTRCPPAPNLTGSIGDADGDGNLNDSTVVWTTAKATSCQLYRGAVLATSFNVPTNTWVDKDRPWGSTTGYQARCVNAGGPGPLSNTVNLLAAPDSPTLTGSHSNGDRTLTWDTPTSATGFELQFRTPANTTWTLLYAGAGTTFADTAAIVSPSFDYQVRATNATGAGNWSNIVTLNPNPDAPALSGVANDGNNALTWAAGANATGYKVYKNGALVATLGNVLSWTDSAPGWASTHNYFVVATNKTGTSPNSNTVTLLQMPGPFSISGGGVTQYAHHLDEDGVALPSNTPAGVYMDWTASSGASSYDTFFDGAQWANDITSSRYPASGYDTTGVTPGNVYTVKVVANAANGRTRTATTKDVLVAPAPPKTVWGATYCNQTYNANGWKFGMQYNNYINTGYATSTDLTTREYHVNNPGGSPLVYSYDRTNRVEHPAMTNVSKESIWGNSSNTDLIGNAVGDGGGYYLENYKTGVTFDFGRTDSQRFGLTGHKTGSGPVACPAGQTTWDYNGNSVTIQRWYVY